MSEVLTGYFWENRALNWPSVSSVGSGSSRSSAQALHYAVIVLKKDEINWVWATFFVAASHWSSGNACLPQFPIDHRLPWTLSGFCSASEFSRDLMIPLRLNLALGCCLNKLEKMLKEVCSVWSLHLQYMNVTLKFSSRKVFLMRIFIGPITLVGVCGVRLVLPL